jgi:hypothetical protein
MAREISWAHVVWAIGSLCVFVAPFFQYQIVCVCRYFNITSYINHNKKVDDGSRPKVSPINYSAMNQKESKVESNSPLDRSFFFLLL